MFLILFCILFNTDPNLRLPLINWNHTKQWKIYKLNSSSRVFAIPTDSIPSLKGIPLNDDSIHIFFRNAKLLRVPSSPAWMGCYLTSCEDEKGYLMKIIISQYGGFILNSFDGNYYQLDDASTPLWL